MRVLLLLLLTIGTAAAQDTYRATITRVIDGDTVIAKFYLLDLTIDARVRLLDIDCPEVNTPAGRLLRDEVRSMLEGQPVRITTSKKDRYGRWLGTIWWGNLNFNDWMLQTKRAHPYAPKDRK